MNRRYIVLGLGGVALALGILTWGISSLVASRANGDILAAKERASVAEGRAQRAEDALKVAEGTRDRALAQLGEANETTKKLQARLDALPKVPTRTVVEPTSDEVAVGRGLHDLGLSPGALDPKENPFRIGLTLPDARTAWQWGLDAQRVPALETRLRATEDLNLGLKDENARAMNLYTSEHSVSEAAKAALQDRKTQVDALNQEIAAWEKKSRADKIRSGFKVAGVTIVATELVRLLIKH